MPARQSILLLVISLLIAIPAGIATAGNTVDIQGTNSRVRVDDDGNVRINSNTQNGTITPLIVPNSSLRNRILLRTWKYPQYSQCSGKTYTHQINRINSYGTAVNRTYSSMTTKSCQ